MVLSCCLYKSLKDTAFLLNLHIVKIAFKYILSVFLGLLMMHQTFAQESIVSELQRYESICRMCLDLRQRVENGERVSKHEAKSTIDLFVAMNNRLKVLEPKMTVLQRQQFKDISEWFATGVKPVRPDPLAEVSNKLEPATVCYEDVSDIVPYSNFNRVTSLQQPSFSNVDVVLLADVAAPELSFGARAGLQFGLIGAYVSYSTNFSSDEHMYECLSDGSIKYGSYIWPNGETSKRISSLNAGLLLRATDWMTFFAGAGKGNRVLLWQDIDANWVKVTDCSYSGLSSEAGAMFFYKHLALSLGVSTIRFKTASITLGAGIRF